MKDRYELIIIGSGMSGISCACHALKNGIEDFIIIEKSNSMGGIWSHYVYDNLKMMLPAKYSWFRSRPMNYEERLTGEQFRDYLVNFAEDIELDKKVLFDTYVKSITFPDNDTDDIELTIDNNKTIKTKYLAVCTGKFNTANKDIDQRSDNKIITHSKWINKYSSDELFYRKKVIIVGNGNTGIDIATLSVDKGASNVKLYYRTPKILFKDSTILHYNVLLINRIHEYIINFMSYSLSYRVLIVSMVLLLQPYLLLFFPLVCLFMTYYRAWDKLDFPDQIWVINSEINKYINKGRIEYIRYNVDSIDRNNYDTLIYCNGYHKDNLLDKTSGFSQGILYNRRVGVIGQMGPTNVNNINLVDLQGEWFIKYIKGDIDPELIKIESSAAFYSYYELLCKDMGIETDKGFLEFPVYG